AFGGFTSIQDANLITEDADLNIFLNIPDPDWEDNVGDWVVNWPGADLEIDGTEILAQGEGSRVEIRLNDVGDSTFLHELNIRDTDIESTGESTAVNEQGSVSFDNVEWEVVQEGDAFPSLMISSNDFDDVIFGREVNIEDSDLRASGNITVTDNETVFPNEPLETEVSIHGSSIQEADSVEIFGGGVDISNSDITASNFVEVVGWTDSPQTWSDLGEVSIEGSSIESKGMTSLAAYGKDLYLRESEVEAAFSIFMETREREGGPVIESAMMGSNPLPASAGDISRDIIIEDSSLTLDESNGNGNNALALGEPAGGDITIEADIEEDGRLVLRDASTVDTGDDGVLTLHAGKRTYLG
ncbi:hypothetical protein, partial [Thioalkalivibrio sp. ALE23]|uniref:hypothetical protein n=1 Tax=Thioalkalivibrio sp. ALE23 TaxID=1265495 RepID=UPI0005715096